LRYPVDQPDCFTCQDEGWCLWDDDQSRYREASFGFKYRKADPIPCRECNESGEYTFAEWCEDYLNPEPPTVGNERI